ncbi:efflux RND transporter permease subunit [Spirochaetota bacterium]
MKKRLIAFFTEKSLIVNLITIGLLLTGLMFVFSINKEAFPNIENNYVIINTLYPGATAEDIEKHISIPIENELREVDGIDEIWSTSLESASIVVVKLDFNLDLKDKIINDIKNAVDMVSDLPEDAEEPIVTEIDMDLIPVLEISIYNPKGILNDKDEREIRKFARNLEDKLRELPVVGKIDKQGYRDREMIVEVQPKRLDEYHVALNDIVMALSKKNLNFPGGLIRTKNEDVMVRTIGEVETVKDISNVLIRANDLGNWVTIGNVAKVKDSFAEEVIINKANNEKSITLTILKKKSADIIKTVDIIRSETKKFFKENPKYEYMTSNDLSKIVKRRLNVLINNAIVGLILVGLSLFLTLGWRIAAVTALGIPLSFCGTFIWMGQFGVTVNMMSMFGLIVVLGMIVDDAIVVAENVYRHLEEGKPVKKAIIDGTSEVIVPIAGTILTTIAAFAPLMFMQGIMGEWMWTLPAVVSVSLLFSWFEAMFILPSHIKDIETQFKKKDTVKKEKRQIYKTFQLYYSNALKFTINNRYKFALLITAIFFGTMIFQVKIAKFIMLPQDKIDRFIIKAEAKTGTSLNEMNQKIGKIEKLVSSLPKKELKNFITKVGIIREQPMDPYEKNGSNYGMVVVDLNPEDERDRKADKIIEDLRGKFKKSKHDFVKVEFTYIHHGPPIGHDIDVTIKGDSFKRILQVAREYKEHLKTIPGLKDIKDNFEEGKKELKVIVDEKKASIAGISVFDVASTVRTCFKGTVATKIKKTDEEIDIRVIFPENLRNEIKSLNKIKISNRFGNLIPLNRIANFDDKTRGISKINRNNWRRAIKVTAEIDEHAKDVTSVRVNTMLMKKFANINKKYPGILVDYVGEFKETQESMQDLGRLFLIAILIIYIILVGIFKSISHPLIIISIIPLTLVGVIWALFFHGMPLSFIALMGVVGLAGVIVNDSIILVSFFKMERAKGYSVIESTLQGAAKRLRPVFLTTITTFFGLIPTAYGIGGFDPMLKPMAVSLAWGLAFGTLITLFATPILYNIFADIKRKVLKRETDSETDEETFYEIENKMEERIAKNIEGHIAGELEDHIKKDIKKYINGSLKSKDKGKGKITKPKRKKSKARKKTDKK